MMKLKPNRAVITGIGPLAANGIGTENFWASLRAGRSGVGPITLFDTHNHPAKVAGEITDFNPHDHLPPDLKPKRLARTTQLALTALKFALHNAGLESLLANGQTAAVPVRSIPLFVGVSYSALDVIDKQVAIMLKKGPRFVGGHVVFTSTPQAVAGALCSYLRAPAETTTLSTACAAGLDAVGWAAEAVQSGRADLVIALGADAPITPFGFASFAAAGLVSQSKGPPEKASRPFDRERMSGIAAEGAGALIIENLEHARARGAVPYAEITGYSSFNDGPDEPHAAGLERTMRTALANASHRAAHVDYLCAHGPGDPLLDRMETAFIKKVFGEHAYRIPVSSIKGVTGNPLAAAGPLQVIACALAMKHGLIPPTANFECGDADCDLDYVGDGERRADLRCALINSHGLGGTNSSLLVERVEAAE